jgi:ABC-2 type transport system permease protein
MTKALRDTQYMTVRHLRALLRQPWWIAVTLVQPIIWLLLFGALFKNVVEIPGFASTSYIQLLTPGVIVMTAFFSSGWGGMAMIDDIDRGVIDRFLVSPANRASLIFGRVLQNSVGIVVQAVIIVVLALLLGATFPNNVWGIAILIGLSVLVAAGFGALSNGVALLLRREESLIGLMQFLLLPLTFLSGAFMQLSLAPDWIQTIAKYNPVNWAVEAGREAVSSSVDWGFVLGRLGLLAALATACVLLATRAFRSYQRSA